MSGERGLAVQQTSHGLAQHVSNLTQAQRDMVNRMCKDATKDELQLLIYSAERMGLDPMLGQVHGVKRWDNQQNRLVMQVQVGIGGFRECARRTGELEARLGPYWCGKDGKFNEVFLESGYPFAAKVGVCRKGCTEPFWAVAYWNESVQVNKKGEPNRTWATMPKLMLAKVAESAALRAAFPDLLSGAYEPSEIGEHEEAPSYTSAQVVQEEPQAPDAEAEQKARENALNAIAGLVADRFHTQSAWQVWCAENEADLPKMTVGQLRYLYVTVRDLPVIKKAAPRSEVTPPTSPEAAAPAAPAELSDHQRQMRRFWTVAHHQFGAVPESKEREEAIRLWIDQSNLLDFDPVEKRSVLSKATAPQLRQLADAMESLAPADVETAVGNYLEWLKTKDVPF